MKDIVQTWLHLPSVDPVHLNRYGITFRASQVVGGVRQGKSGNWLLPVFIDPPSVFHVVDDPALIDLVVFDPVRPDEHHIVLGEGIMLGEEAFREARLDRLPLPVFKSPMTWLREAGAGVCPLDMPAFARAMLGHEIDLIGQDLVHAKQIKRAITTATKLGVPKIKVAA